MKRHLITELEAWKNSADRQPLLLLGARQVGKTWLMQEFGRTHFEHTAYVRFDNDPNMRRAFEQDFDMPRLLNAIQLRTGVPVLPQKTLIILDEIQECSAALTSLKYFCEELPEYAVIAAGSLLGVEELYGTGFPVGKVERLTLYPMSYAEFLEAMDCSGYAELLAKRDFSMIGTFCSKYEEMLRYYYYIGGMPQVVANFAQHRDFRRARTIQKRLLADYRADFRKHTDASTARAMAMLWDSLPAQLAQENKRFTYAEVNRQAGAKLKTARLREPLAWLEAAGLICPVRRVFVADNSRIKCIETVLGTGDGFFRAMDKLGHTDVANRRLLVIGYGKVGRGIAFYARDKGMKVTIADLKDKSGELPGDFSFVNANDTEALNDAILRSWCTVTATGHISALRRQLNAAAITNSPVLLANMGVEDEYGSMIPVDRVLNKKRPLNFILDEPTSMRYIETTMALHNACGLELLTQDLPRKCMAPTPDVVEHLLDIACTKGLIGDDIRRMDREMA